MRIFLVSLFFANLALGEITSIEELKPIQRAHDEVTEIKLNYRKALESAVTKGGPANAIGSCRIDASTLKSLKKGSQTVGRTSHRLRNPSNLAPEWVKPILESWAKAKPADIPKNQIVELGGQHYGYVEPIFTEAICLNCHGAHLTTMMKKVLKASYPDDQATGFELGQLRGIIWLENKP